MNIHFIPNVIKTGQDSYLSKLQMKMCLEYLFDNKIDILILDKKYKEQHIYNKDNLDISILEEIEQMKINKPKKYDHVILGGWLDKAEGVIIENWIDWVLHPKWFFSYRSYLPESKFFGNYGYPVPGAMKNKIGIVSMTYGGPMLSYFNFSLFDNIPYRRLKKSVFQLGGLKTKYLRFYSVLPNMSNTDFERHMTRVRKFARNFRK